MRGKTWSSVLGKAHDLEVVGSNPQWSEYFFMNFKHVSCCMSCYLANGKVDFKDMVDQDQWKMKW